MEFQPLELPHFFGWITLWIPGRSVTLLPEGSIRIALPAGPSGIQGIIVAEVTP